jgi:hypothetical protein
MNDEEDSTVDWGRYAGDGLCDQDSMAIALGPDVQKLHVEPKKPLTQKVLEVLGSLIGRT